MRQKPPSTLEENLNSDTMPAPLFPATAIWVRVTTRPKSIWRYGDESEGAAHQPILSNTVFNFAIHGSCPGPKLLDEVILLLLINPDPIPRGSDQAKIVE